MENTIEIKYKFGKSQEIEIEGKIIKAYHHDKNWQYSAFDVFKKIYVVKMAIFNRKNNISKFAIFASFDGGKKYTYIKTKKA